MRSSDVIASIRSFSLHIPVSDLIPHVADCWYLKEIHILESKALCTGLFFGFMDLARHGNFPMGMTDCDSQGLLRTAAARSNGVQLFGKITGGIKPMSLELSETLLPLLPMILTQDQGRHGNSQLYSFHMQATPPIPW
jgi:hypothetical protein